MTKQYTEHLELILNETNDLIAFKPDYQATLQKIDDHAEVVDAALAAVVGTPGGLAAEITNRAQADSVLTQANAARQAEIQTLAATKVGIAPSSNTITLYEGTTAPPNPFDGLYWFNPSVDSGTSLTGSDTWLKSETELDDLITGPIVRNATGTAISSPVVWPDGSSGTYTALVLSTAFLGAVDSYRVTYVPISGPAKTVTQPTVTRDATGAVTIRPVLVVS